MIAKRNLTEMLRRRISIGLFAATTLSMAVLAAPAAASASNGPDKIVDPGTGTVTVAGVNCRDGHHCLFFSDFASSKHEYFNSDTNFSDDTFSGGNGVGGGHVVDNNSWSASNSSNSGYESHYYYGFSYASGRVFCVNPGHSVDYTRLTDDGVDGNGIGQRDEASSLRLRPTTTIRCF